MIPLLLILFLLGIALWPKSPAPEKRSSLRKCSFIRTVCIHTEDPWRYEEQQFEGYFHKWVDSISYGKPITLAKVEDEQMRLFDVEKIEFTEK